MRILPCVLLSAAVLAGCVGGDRGAVATPRLAVFHSHLVTMARERGMALAEVVRAVRAWGIEGVDVFDAADHGEAAEIMDLGMACAAFIVSADLAQTEDSDVLDRALAVAKARRASLIMLVPGQVPPGMSRETAWRIAKPRIAAFADRAAAAGLTVALEDFDWGEPIVGSAGHLRRAFREVPSLRHVFDTGNYLRWNEDPLSALREFQPRVCHVHAKALGGRVPLAEIVRRLKAVRYDGWITIECFDATEMWSAVESAAGNIRKWEEER